MRARYIHEPELEFGGEQRHVDIRYGMMNSGPLDVLGENAPREVRLGLVGVPETVNGLSSWFEKCGGGIDAKDSRFTNLYARFPGFGEHSNLVAPLVTSGSTTSEVAPRSVNRLFGTKGRNAAVEEAVDLFFGELEHLGANKNVDVLVCAPPKEIWDLMDREDVTEDEESDAPARTDFHDLLKSRGLRLPQPIQVIWPPTYTGKSVERKRKRGGAQPVKRNLQDEATRAWNLYVALYYKAGGVPWRLVRDASDYSSCYVGVSFYNTLDKSRVQTSVAQVFNERGEGIILNGGPAHKSKDGDRQIHIDQEGAYDLLRRSLESFRREHKRTPARVVLHKTSAFNDAETDGFWRACEEERIEMMDLISLRSTTTRLFRTGQYSPLRGTFVSLDYHNNLLQTRGSIDFYGLTPSLYVPKTLAFDVHDGGDPLTLAQEILQLTKMSWNNTHMDNLMPITVEAARKVASLLKYVEGDGWTSSYRYFM